MKLLNAPKLTLTILKTAAALKRKKLATPPVFGDAYRQRFFGDPLHVCYGCSHTNEKSLKLDFFKTNQGGLGCIWIPQPGLESFPNIIHGGLSATILDELGGVVIQSDDDVFAVTVSSNFFYHSPVYLDQKIYGYARIVSRFKKYILVEGQLFDAKSKIFCSMSGLYYVPSKKAFNFITKLKQYSPEIESYVAK